jgi:ornithine cyclodeaminase
MRIVGLPEIRRALIYRDVIDRMRVALIAQSRGECDTPMPMHLNIAPASEVHIKSSYRRGGRYFALKIASTFPANAERGLPTGNGMMLLSSAETGEPVAFLADAGHLTDVRTAAVAAMAARELQRTDTAIAILGTGIQARLQALMHAEILDLREIVIWGRSPERVEAFRVDMHQLLPNVGVSIASSPADAAGRAKLLIAATASREPLLHAADIQPGTHISAVGSDSPGKQELDPRILWQAALLLVDSRQQCEKLGELQHAPEQRERAIEIGAFCQSKPPWDGRGITVCDMTGLGVEDLYISEYCYENSDI